MGTFSTRLAHSLLLGLFGVVPFALTACPASLDARCSENACDAAAAATDSGGDGSNSDGGIDPCVDNPTLSMCKDNALAIFVSGVVGKDSNDGTKELPVQTIAGALSKVTAEKHRIYVCEGTYAEDVTLTNAHNGVSILGGVKCDWTDAPVKPIIGATALPLRIDAASMVSIADLDFEAKDSSTGSSIAALLMGADVTFKRVRLAAGNGANGGNGVLVPFTTFPSQMDLNGKGAPADNISGGAENSVTCPGGTKTVGGQGGSLGNSGASGTPGPTNAGTLSNCSDFRDGQPGVAWTPANGAAVAGHLSGTGWEPQPGDDGAVGAPGQGGGGGYGNSGGGGGGGAGGCGGAGGPGGKGGGASIAIAANGGRVTVSGNSQLIAKVGGVGGDGADGQAPQGEAGFRGGATGNACQGGAGGAGAKGAPGGGGAGGISAAVIYKGSQPTLDPDTDVQLGASGAGGKGAASSGKNGVTPDAQRILEST